MKEVDKGNLFRFQTEGVEHSNSFSHKSKESEALKTIGLNLRGKREWDYIREDKKIQIKFLNLSGPAAECFVVLLGNLLGQLKMKSED